MDRLIDRPRYLSRIRPFVGIPVIKILTGVRRSGKSTLLQMLSAEISQSHPDAVVVHLNLESEAGLSIRTPQNLLDALRHCGADSHSRSYIFLDEVQRLESWEDAINAIRVDWDCDLYLTGSNSTMLSSELATNLAGRYTEFSIRPLAFAEFAELYPNEADRHALFEDYVSVGGFPLLKYFNRSLAPSLQYLQSVVDTVVVRDVIEHRNIRDVDLFQRILRYCVGNIGRTFSAHSIVRYLKSEGRTVSVDTVLSYLDYCTQAFLIERVPRFDITGKTVLRADEKYYAVDHQY